MQAKHFLMTLSPRKPLSAESRSSNLLCLYLLFVANAVDLQNPEIVHGPTVRAAAHHLRVVLNFVNTSPMRVLLSIENLDHSAHTARLGDFHARQLYKQTRFIFGL